MQVNGFKNSLFGLKKEEVLSYLDTLSKDVEAKIRSKDDDIRNLKKELSDKKDKIKDLKAEMEEQKVAFEKKTEELKAEFSKEKEEMQEKLNDLKVEFTVEKEKIGRALLNAEETANQIIADATRQAEEIVAEAKKKADLEKERYKKSKADVSDFTYDIKRLMEKLTADLKERLD